MPTPHLGDINGGSNEKKWRNPHEDFSEDEVDSKYPNIPQDPQGYKKKAKQEDLP
jgi:hypothetical protein